MVTEASAPARPALPLTTTSRERPSLTPDGVCEPYGGRGAHYAQLLLGSVGSGFNAEPKSGFLALSHHACILPTRTAGGYLKRKRVLLPTLPSPGSRPRTQNARTTGVHRVTGQASGQLGLQRPRPTSRPDSAPQGHPQLTTTVTKRPDAPLSARKWDSGC